MYPPKNQKRIGLPLEPKIFGSFPHVPIKKKQEKVKIQKKKQKTNKNVLTVSFEYCEMNTLMYQLSDNLAFGGGGGGTSEFF
jgi:hypothetical protein